MPTDNSFLDAYRKAREAAKQQSAEQTPPIVTQSQPSESSPPIQQTEIVPEPAQHTATDTQQGKATRAAEVASIEHAEQTAPVPEPPKEEASEIDQSTSAVSKSVSETPSPVPSQTEAPRPAPSEAGSNLPSFLQKPASAPMVTTTKIATQKERPSKQEKQQKMPKEPGNTGPLVKKLILGTVATVLVLIILGGGLLIVRQNPFGASESTSQSAFPQQGKTLGANQELANQYVTEIGRLIELPNDPNMTVGVISEVERLRQTNKFFDKAKNGDVLVIAANRAVLYDPNKKLIVEVAPVDVVAPSEAAASLPPETPATSSSSSEE